MGICRPQRLLEWVGMGLHLRGDHRLVEEPNRESGLRGLACCCCLGTRGWLQVVCVFQVWESVVF